MSVPEPSKILTPWATSGLKNAIPATANPVTGNAGYDQGFPAINMTPKEAGGIPPFGQDFNGILFSVTEALRYIQAGGTPTYSAALSTAIGGYPKGAIILGNDGVTTYRSLIDSNTNNPNTTPTKWAKNDSDRFSSSLAANGYQKLPNGLIIQWGSANNAAAATSVATYPIAFPSAVLSAVVCGGNINGSIQAYAVMNTPSLTNFTWNAFFASSGNSPVQAPSAGQVTARYIAIGY